MTKEQKYKCEQEFNQKVKSGNITTITNTNEYKGYKKGDWVILKNGYGIEVGPFKILGFNNENKIFLNWDCYWYSIPCERIVKIVESEY